MFLLGLLLSIALDSVDSAAMDECFGTSFAPYELAASHLIFILFKSNLKLDEIA